MTNTHFHPLRSQLKSVSRSFYLSLRILPSSLQPAVGLAYLLCKTADTISDTLAVSYENRLDTLHRFKDLFGAFPIPEKKLMEFSQDLSLSNMIPHTAEGRLLTQFTDSMSLFKRLSRTDQSLIQDVVLAIIKGMEIDLTTFGESAESVKALGKSEDLEIYITLIGGEPGRFWTKICLEHLPRLRILNRDQWLLDGIEFGKGLQMINILRDLPNDLKQGRCYIPLDSLSEQGLTPESLLNEPDKSVFLTLYHQLIDETLSYLSHGLNYIFQIQRSFWRCRAAVWWPLIIGLQTLAQLRTKDDILTSTNPVKIKRWDVYRLVSESFVMLGSNRWLEKEFEKLR